MSQSRNAATKTSHGRVTFKYASTRTSRPTSCSPTPSAPQSQTSRAERRPTCLRALPGRMVTCPPWRGKTRHDRFARILLIISLPMASSQSNCLIYVNTTNVEQQRRSRRPRTPPTWRWQRPAFRPATEGQRPMSTTKPVYSPPRRSYSRQQFSALRLRGMPGAAPWSRPHNSRDLLDSDGRAPRKPPRPRPRIVKGTAATGLSWKKCEICGTKGYGNQMASKTK